MGVFHKMSLELIGNNHATVAQIPNVIVSSHYQQQDSFVIR